MRLTKFRYGQFEGQPREWVVDGLSLGPTNLLVGKNASGKSRTLNVIRQLAKMFTGEAKPAFQSGHFTASFTHNNTHYHYDISIDETKVTKESLIIDADVRLERGRDGSGTIFAVKEGKPVEFQTPIEEMAAFARRDAIQHPFFDPLYQWGNSLRYYPFGTPLGRENLAILINDPNLQLNENDFNNVIGIFKKGERRFGADFTTSILEDMRSLEYDIEIVGVKPASGVQFLGPNPFNQNQLVSMFVKERSLATETEQVEMSQGMFRALSLIIQLNYSRMATTAYTIVIDDIGEGLDFERSCALVNLIMRKSFNTDVQLIMATNDRFVMNKVPLDTWSLLQRDGNHCRVFNRINSPKAFEEFKFTGLNNFDFFASDFVNDSEAVVNDKSRSS